MKIQVRNEITRRALSRRPLWSIYLDVNALTHSLVLLYFAFDCYEDMNKKKLKPFYYISEAKQRLNINMNINFV